MNDKLKPIAKKETSAGKIKSEIIKAPNGLLLPSPHHNGEYTIDFNKYLVVYSNNVSGNLSSSWRAGETAIDCYKDDKFVGCLCFYVTAERMNGGYVDANGVVVIEYPLEKFEDIMRILRTFNNLSLLFVEKDMAGTPLAHPVGALMTFERKLIGG